MIGPGFLDAASRQELMTVLKDGKEEARITRRANALLLLDDGWSCERVAPLPVKTLDDQNALACKVPDFRFCRWQAQRRYERHAKMFVFNTFREVKAVLT